MLPDIMVVTQFSQVSVKEPEKETIYIMKWLNQVLFNLKKKVQDAHLFMDKWTNHQVPELELV